MNPDTVGSDISWADSSPNLLSSSTAAGKIQMMGMDAVESRLGSKWERMSELVHRYFEAAIRRELGPGDTFCHYGPSIYLLLFRNVSIAEAQLKCRAIAEEVCRKLFGDDEDISVRNLILSVDDHDISSSTGRERLNELLERDGRASTFRKNDPGQEIKKHMNVRITDRGHETYSLPLTNTAFKYRPLWDTTRAAILTYICQPVPQSGPCEVSGIFEAVGNTIQIEEQERLHLDRILLAECAKRSQILRESGNRALLLSPLHFSTLSIPRLWKQYSDDRNSLPAAAIADIGFLVHGIGADTPNIRLIAELPKLSVSSRHVYCLAEKVKGVADQFRNTGIRAVGTVIMHNAHGRELNGRLDVLGHEARLGGVDAFALGVTNRSLAVNAIGFGMRWLEGGAISSAVTQPKFSFVHRAEDLYHPELTAAGQRSVGG